MQRQPGVFSALPGELWWGGAVGDGTMMPFGATHASVNLCLSLKGNQGAPFFLSNRGRYVWSDRPFEITFDHARIQLGPAQGEIFLQQGHANLREAFLHASHTYFAPSGTRPPTEVFKTPQYNTWIEMGYQASADKVIAYAEDILAHKFPPGVLIIDDNWQEDYGTWRFHAKRFRDPAAMVSELHALGFSVMVWISPFVSPDSQTFRTLRRQGLLVRQSSSEPVIRSWWNGYSALLDGSHPDAVQWLHGRLRTLIDRYGIDGFKFDAGDPEYYQRDDVTFGHVTPMEQCRLWSLIGSAYSFNELRSSWRMGGQALVQRLRDKHHSWDDHGLKALIPNGLAQGLLGYPFSCPDMVGGGLDDDFESPGFQLDQELFVRYAQCSALFPIMQFSMAPWRVLDKAYLGMCLDAVRLRMRLADEIIALADVAARRGEPIMRHLSYVFPDQGYDLVRDQFMLGDHILVAPVLDANVRHRKVRFPPGVWRSDDGMEIGGPVIRQMDAPLEKLLWYRRCD